MSRESAARPASGRLPSVVVVGAGIAGLVAARTLADRGHDIAIVDKGRGPGGRVATRRGRDVAFDHGAQYFTARSEPFRRHVASWLDAGVVAPWNPRLVVFDETGRRAAGREHVRYVGTPSMNALAKYLARDLDLRTRTQITDIERVDARWRLGADDGTTDLRADVVLVTVPPAQAAPLLPAVPELAATAAGVCMDPTWACLVAYDAPVPADFDGAFLNDGPLAWAARNSSKPGRGRGDAWVLHATAAWTRAHLDTDPETVVTELTTAFVDRVGRVGMPGIVHTDAHRWRYAQPAPALELTCLFDDALRIGAGGDWCGGPRVEGAFLSGAALAERVLGLATTP